MLALLFILWFISFVMVMAIVFNKRNLAFAIAVITNFVLALALAVFAVIVYQSNKSNSVVYEVGSIDV